MMAQNARGLRKKWLLTCGIGYVVLVGTVVWAMFAARDRTLAVTSTTESVAQWGAWRDDVIAQQDEATPVQRRVPESTEPPALILMRDYFGVSLAGAIVFSSLLYWVLAWLVAGTLGGAAEVGDST